MYEIQQKFITKNRSWQTFSPIGIVCHDTANQGGTDEGHYNYFNNNYLGASAHAFVDWDSITQTVPWNEIAWHAGYTANSKFIGIEWCRPKEHSLEQFNEIWKRGVWLYAHVYKNILGITELNDENFWTHKRVSETWAETDHVDPDSFLNEYSKSVDDLKSAIQKCINTGEIDDLTQGGNIMEARSIRRLQSDLNWFGFVGKNGSQLIVDGDFGANSQYALSKFREGNGLNITGDVTEADWELIEKVRYGIVKAKTVDYEEKYKQLLTWYYQLITEVKSLKENQFKSVNEKIDTILQNFQ